MGHDDHLDLQKSEDVPASAHRVDLTARLRLDTGPESARFEKEITSYIDSIVSTMNSEEYEDKYLLWLEVRQYPEPKGNVQSVHVDARFGAM